MLLPAKELAAVPHRPVWQRAADVAQGHEHQQCPLPLAVCGCPSFWSRTMRIAQVAPLYESVPPQQYGGTERVVSYLTEELVRQGHEVTLFASGDSVTQAQLIACCPR